jgi:hypothetical protein
MWRIVNAHGISDKDSHHNSPYHGLIRLILGLKGTEFTQIAESGATRVQGAGKVEVFRIAWPSLIS